MRPLVSTGLAFLILLGQVGLPMHFHYCKGMLASVSFFMKSVCDDHEEDVARLPVCCRKTTTTSNSCDRGKEGCCDDRTTILSQDLTSLLPKLFSDALDLHPVEPVFFALHKAPLQDSTPCAAFRVSSDHGPPLFIRHQALLLYA